MVWSYLLLFYTGLRTTWSCLYGVKDELVLFVICVPYPYDGGKDDLFLFKKQLCSLQSYPYGGVKDDLFLFIRLHSLQSYCYEGVKDNLFLFIRLCSL